MFSRLPEGRTILLVPVFQTQLHEASRCACDWRHPTRNLAAARVENETIVPETIPVSYGVTANGDAALTLPLAVPPGRAGVEPSLAITYSSSDGDSVFGVFFSLLGASSITRCTKTMAIDGEIRDVQYDASDAFCLDIQRLLSVAQNGESIEYRTFLDDTRVYALGMSRRIRQNRGNSTARTKWRAARMARWSARGRENIRKLDLMRSVNDNKESDDVSCFAAGCSDWFVCIARNGAHAARLWK